MHVIGHEAVRNNCEGMGAGRLLNLIDRSIDDRRLDENERTAICADR
jgi:hypothetical protein